LNLRNPAQSAARLHQSSVEACATLVASLTGDVQLDSMAHAQSVRQASTSARKERLEEEQGFVETMASSASRPGKKRLGRIGLTGAWLTQMPSKLNGTILSKDEFCDNVRLRYGMRPINLCERCDGCGAGFSVDHALSCRKGVL
jgi:hypothetical protein